MNIFKKILMTTVAAISVALCVCAAGFIMHQFLSIDNQSIIAAQEQQIETLNAQLVLEGRTVSLHELEVVYTAQAIEGEARGHEDDWALIMSAIVNRVHDTRWSDSLIGVLLTTRPSGEGCEIDAMCDRIMENLSSDTGFAALAFAERALTEIHTGDFVLATSAHSWATPAAADGHAYFEGLISVAEGSGHIYFADQQTRPKMRPDCLPDCVPVGPTRPQMRPAPSVPPVVIPGDSDVIASL
jgi:hypothetical protein